MKEPGHLWACVQNQDGLIVHDWDGHGTGSSGLSGPYYELLKFGDLPFTAWVSFYDSVDWIDFPFEVKEIAVPAQ